MTSSRQDLARDWYHHQQTRRLLRWLWHALVCYWYLVVPLVLALVASWWLGLIALMGCIYGEHRLRLRRRALLLDTVSKAGGEGNYALLSHIDATWKQAMVDAGLARRPTNIDGVGLTAAYERVQYAVEQRLTHEAFGDPNAFEYPLLVAAHPGYLGLDITVAMLDGQVVDHYLAAAPVLGNIWGFPEVRVRQSSPGYVVLTPVSIDPLAQPREVTVEALPLASTTGVVVGVQEDGPDVIFPLDQNNAVVGGVPGSGKSVCLNVLLAGAAQVPEIQIVGIDCKRGVEFHDWQPRLSDFAVDQETALDVLQRLDQLGQRRLDALRGSGFKSLSRKGYTRSEPLILCVIDECSELFEPGGTKESKALAAELVSLVSRGVRLYRAAGIVYVSATQKPTVDVLPSIIRDNCPFKTAYRCTTDEQAVAIMSGEIRGAQVTPTSISREQPGVCVVSTSPGEFTRARTFWIEERTVEQVARMTAPLRIPLDDVDGRGEPPVFQVVAS